MKTILLIICLTLSIKSFAQVIDISRYPEIGKPMPKFKLNNLEGFSKKVVTNEDFKGKPLIIDFGASWCTSCFSSYPKINSFQTQYKDVLQFLLVLKPDNEIKRIYEAYSKKLKLNLPVTIDSLLWINTVHTAVPHCIWINSDGVVKAITHPNDINETNLEAFIADKEFNFIDRSAKMELKMLQNRPPKGVIGKGLEEEDKRILFKSSFEFGADSLTQVIPYELNTGLEKRGRIKLTNVYPFNLYMLAYFNVSQIPKFDDSLYNNYYPNLILEISDSTLFKNLSTNRFIYSQVLPEKLRTIGRAMNIMQDDLERYFGYKAVVVERKVPVWYLTANDVARRKIKSKGGEIKFDADMARMNFQNVPIGNLLKTSSGFLKGIPVFNATGISGNIDSSMNILATDTADYITELNKRGLFLVKGEKKMKCIVIRDPEPIKASSGQVLQTN